MQDLSAIALGTSPSFNPDTSVHVHATDGAGALVIGDDGLPIQIAQDLNTGAWWAKVLDSMPFNGPNKKDLKAYVDGGAVHVPHADGRFRGVWMPVPTAKKAAKAN